MQEDPPFIVHDKHIFTFSCNFAAGYQTQFLATPGAANMRRKSIIFYPLGFNKNFDGETRWHLIHTYSYLHKNNNNNIESNNNISQ